MKKPIKKPKRELAKKTNDDNIGRFLSYGINIEDRIIHLFDSIDSNSVGVVMQGIQIMISKTPDKPIDIYINSFGGDPYGSFLLYDFIKSCHSTEINTYCAGCAMSGGSIIFLAGDNKYMFKNSVLMLHSVSSIADGKLFEIKIEADECQEIYNQLCQIYADNSTRTFKQWKVDLQYKDRYYRKDKALELKLVDKIIE